MPAQKRPLEATTPPPTLPPPLEEEEKADDSPQGSENRNNELDENSSDSDESSYSSGGEKDEFIIVKLAEIRKEVQCPICLGIIRKTRTVMECLHRFCRECIDKSMRLGNNECPACRTHCASRRSLRDDPNYDSLIAALYPDIDKYEEEELAFHEEEKARNKQIQASIAQTFRRQAEALGKKRAAARRQGTTNRNLRGRRNTRAIETQNSDESERSNGHDGSKDSSSDDEPSPEVKSKRQKRWGSGTRSSQDKNFVENNDSGTPIRELSGAEILGWGRGGMRSNTRNGAPTGARGRASRNNRIAKLIDRLKNANENNESLRISVMLVSLHEEKMPNLIRPYLCCSPTSSIKHLCQYVANQTSSEAKDIEILLMKGFPPISNSLGLKKEPSILNHPSCDELHLLDEHQTLGDVHASFTQQNLVLAYRQKEQASETDQHPSVQI